MYYKILLLVVIVKPDKKEINEIIGRVGNYPLCPPAATGMKNEDSGKFKGLFVIQPFYST